MSLIAAALAAAALLTLAAYAHHRIPFHTAGRGRVFAARAVLVATAIAFGAVMARHYSGWFELPPLLIFLSSFGVVHVPAAIILFIKRRRGAGKS